MDTSAQLAQNTPEESGIHANGVSGCRARVTLDSGWDDEAPTLPSNTQSIDPIQTRVPVVAQRGFPASARRKDARQPVDLEIEFDRDAQFYAGLTQDISKGGVFIATYQLQPIGTPLSLSFELPDGTKIVASGEVRWIRETLNPSPGMGVAFTEISDASLGAITRFCSHCAPMYIEF